MSQQNSATPLEFLEAVERDFNVRFGFDLACTREDSVVKRLHGEDSGFFYDEGVDSLTEDWTLVQSSVSWLNPPWKRIGPWAQKCHRLSEGTRVFSHFPAGVGTDWFRTYVLGKCAVYCVNPRVTYIDPRTSLPFVNPKTGKPQTGVNDSLLCDWHGIPGVYSYCWKQSRRSLTK